MKRLQRKRMNSKQTEQEVAQAAAETRAGAAQSNGSASEALFILFWNGSLLQNNNAYKKESLFLRSRLPGCLASPAYRNCVQFLTRHAQCKAMQRTLPNNN